LRKVAAIQVTIANEQTVLRVNRRRLAMAVRIALAGQRAANVSLAVVDDPRIHELNRRYLAHDYPTDVLSFVLEQSDGYLEGEVIVSAERAQAECGRYGWGPAEELLLYVVHGALHLAGYDDLRPGPRRVMRAQEKACLTRLGIEMPTPGRRRNAGADRRVRRGEAAR
jgi:probable rRNA maturation factor